MCSREDDPSMHDVPEVIDLCMKCGEHHLLPEQAAYIGLWTPGADEEWSYDHESVSSIHTHPNIDAFVIGCPPCEYGAIRAEAQDQRRHQNY